MKKYFLFILSIWFCVTSNAYCESQLRKYHQISLLPHSGQVNLYMDLQNLSDPDFDLTIGLQYLSDGFRPLSYSGPVGDNWSLVASGYITREIMGIADDRYYESKSTSSSGNTYTDCIEKGLLVLLRDSSYSMETEESMYAGQWSSTNPWQSVLLNTESQHLDVQSDIYSFKVQGHSGRFMIGLDGSIDILSGDFVSVDLSNMPIQDKKEPNYQPSVSALPLYSEPLASSITIKTLDGYTYVFGGNTEYLAYTLPFSHYVQVPDITTWMLNCIIAPNQREIRFHYKQPTATDSLKHFSFHTSVQVDTDDIASDYFLTDTLYLNPYVNNHLSSFYTCNASYLLEKQIMLDSITCSDSSFRVIFAYDSLPNIVYSADNYSHALDNNMIYRDYWTAKKYFLTNIKVYNTNQLLSDWELAYHSPVISSATPNYQRQYLQTVRHTIADLVYQFDYDFTSCSNIAVVNNLDSVDLSGYYIPNPQIGALSEMHDPLGKITQFGYAPCRYDSIRLIKQLDTEYTSVVRPISNTPKILNTIVLSSIKSFNNVGKLLSHKEYSYGDFPDNAQPLSLDIPGTGGQIQDRIGEGSGILNVDFAIDISDDLNQLWNGGKSYLVIPYISPRGSKNAKIEYSKVKEYEYKVNTSAKLYQNILYYDKTYDVIMATSNCKYDLLRAYSYISQCERRQSLLLKEEYTGTQLSSQHIYDYEPIVSQQTPWNVGRNGMCAYKIFIPSNQPTRERAIIYEPSGNYEIQTSYLRDEKHRVIQETVSQNDQTHFVRYTYPDQLFENNPSYHSFNAMGYKGLVNRHEINKPIETLQGFIRNGISYITSGALQLYQAYNWSGMGYGEVEPPIVGPNIPGIRMGSLLNQPEYYAPVVSYSLGIDAPMPLNEFSGIRIEDNNVVFDVHYDTIATYRYNKDLRLVKQTIAGVTTDYVWDDNKICITKQSVGSLTTQYTHIPYVGVSSVTSPRGITTYYTYDVLGNLIEVYQMHNNKKIILQANMFHYQNQL
jgi:hypothetical protein